MKRIKQVILGAAALLMSTTLFAQARETSVMIDKENRNAVMIAIDQPAKLTRDALNQRMERAGLKERIRTGVTKYKGVTLAEIDPGVLDIYTRVEEGPSNSSIVYMAVSKGYDNFTNSTADSMLTKNVKVFLESFIQDADTHSADVGIGTQQDEVTKDEKVYQQMLREQQDLQKKVTVMEAKIVQLQNDLVAKRESIDKKRSALEVAKVKRNNMNVQ